MVNKNSDDFWKRVEVCGPDDCWEWQGSKWLGLGYGRLRWFGRPSMYAHRVAWVLTKGEILDGLCVLHRCDNPPCCNPDHLFIGTRTDNCDDMWRKGCGKRVDPMPGEKNGQSKLTAKNVMTIRRTYRRGVVTQKMLAKRFGVCRAAIRDILQGKNWSHLPGGKRTTKLGHPNKEEIRQSL